MSEDPVEAGTVIVVDSDGQLTRVAEAIERGGIDDVRTVEDIAAIGTDSESIGCVLVPHKSGEFDGIAAMEAVRDRAGDVPVGIYTREPDRETVFHLLKAGADTVIGIPPERDTVLAARIRHLAGATDPEPMLQQFASFLDHYPERVFLKDHCGRFLNITQADGYEGENIDREQVIGLTDYELYDREHADRLFEEEQELLAREEAIEEKIEHYVENGEDQWISTTKVPRYDEDGNLLGLVGNVRDVTAIKRQERMMTALHDASQRLVRAGSKAEIGRVAVDIATEIDALPGARVDLFDPDTGALTTVETVEDVAWDERSFQRVAATKEPEYQTDTGEFVTVDVAEHDHRELELPDTVETVSGIRVPLGEHGVIGVDAGEGTLDPFTIELAHVLAANTEAALDRAEQKRRLATQSARLEEFASLSSHELRNRLQIALGAAERARAEDDVDAVDDVIETLGRMDRLVGQLLTLARTGSVSHSTESIALSGIVETAWHSIPTGDASLSVSGDAVIAADRGALLEVFEMLFRTTIEGGSGHVRVGTLSDGFYAEDDGSSIKPAALFEPTYSDGNVPDDSVYLVSVIADAHEWSVDVEPSDIGGTRFSFQGVDIAHVE
ncbi:MAG: PAS domain-containing protein [Halapricum sp.]